MNQVRLLSDFSVGGYVCGMCLCMCVHMCMWDECTHIFLCMSMDGHRCVCVHM